MTDTPRLHPTDHPSPRRRFFARENLLTLFAVALLLLVLGLWLWLTPSGLLGKADAVGYAVCHRIDARSFHFPGGRQTPLCARCSGTFLGVLVGLCGPGLLFRRRRRAGMFPPIGLLAVMVGASALWAFDGANSYAHLLPEGVPRLYTPHNWLRLTTGMFHGITMGSLVLPVFNATIWAEANRERTLGRLHELLILYAIGAALIVLVLTEQPIVLYPLALLSAVGTVAILATVNTLIVAMVIQRENASHTWREALPVVLFGLVVTILMIGAIDAVRFALFRSWDGFSIG